MDTAAIPHLGSVPLQGLELAASGGCCNIYRQQFRDRTILSIKTLRVTSRRDGGWYATWEKRMREVLSIWVKCRHPNIVQLLGEATIQGRVAIVYNWHEYGNIRQYLTDRPMIDRYQLSAQICEGVAFLHDNHIVHGNLKGNKIMISSSGVPKIRLCTKRTAAEGTFVDDPEFTTRRWLAPELLEQKSEYKFTFATDIYSLGLETITGSVPYDGIIWTHEVALRISGGNTPSRPIDSIPDNKAGNLIWDTLSKCWSYDPGNRPAAADVCVVMRTVHRAADGVAIRLKVVVRESTSVQALAPYFEMCGLTNYPDLLQRTDISTAIPFADTALANVYKIKIMEQKHVAVKCVKHTTPHKKLKRAARELSCWASYKHENILPVLGFAVVKGDLAMVSPWMNNGCITDYVVSNPSSDRLALCMQVARAIAYLHENNVVHGDIKGPNVLVSDTGTAQVTDFGVSIVDHQEIEFSSTAVGGGSHRWQAPEILLGGGDILEDRSFGNGSRFQVSDENRGRDGDSSKEGDVYALGMTMIEIYTGARPYDQMNWTGRMQQYIISGRLRPFRPFMLPLDNTGNEIWELMSQCWAGSPDERPTSQEVYGRLSGINAYELRRLMLF